MRPRPTAPRRRRRPALTPYPAAMVLPSGLKATLRTSPSFTGSGSSTRRLRAATSHSTTPPPSPTPYAVSGRDGLAVWAEGHAPNVALFHGEWLVDQAFACGHVPQHHAAATPPTPLYPAAMVLPSGLKATLATLPSWMCKNDVSPGRS